MSGFFFAFLFVGRIKYVKVYYLIASIYYIWRPEAVHKCLVQKDLLILKKKNEELEIYPCSFVRVRCHAIV
jgi:hypothetical protein